MKLRQLSTNKTSITFFQNPFPHLFKANPQSLPERIVLRYSITQHLDEILGCVLSPIFFGCLLISKAPEILHGYFLFLVGIALGYYTFRKRFHAKYRIVFTHKGIQVAPGQFFRWYSVKNIRIIQEGSGKYASHYLVYRHPKGKEKIQIDGYNIDPTSMQELLVKYRNKQPDKIVSGKT